MTRLFEKKFLGLTLLFIAGAILSAIAIIGHAKTSTKSFDQILATYNLQNEGAQSLERFDKEHPFLGAFVSGPARHNFELPSEEESNHALNSQVAHLLRNVRLQSAAAAWWSCFLLNLSLLYVVTVVLLSRSFTARSVLFALTCVGVIFFLIGIIAPAMVIWTAPTVPMESGKLNFVLQHEVRGIMAVILELFRSGHWIIAGFLLLFSVITPLTKAALTFCVTASRSQKWNNQIGQFLHSIGKWSMADVFVAGVILALFALQSQEATKSIACLGLYYFIGYCLLSMTTTELLVHSGLMNQRAGEREERKLGRRGICILLAATLCVMLGATFYTYKQHTVRLDEKLRSSSSPQQLKEDDLPAHK